MIFYGQKLLFLGAHPDDIELGCGALISNVVRNAEVIAITLSDNKKNPRLKGVVEELHRSMSVLGVAPGNVIVGSFETRNFPRDRQQILEYLYQVNTKYQPEVVFVHTRADIHQDHAVVTDEALRAFRGKTVLGFDVLRSSYGFFPNFLVRVSAADVEGKIQALAQYETYSDKYYFRPDVIRATLVRHGALAEVDFAEGLDILRVVGSFSQSDV